MPNLPHPPKDRLERVTNEYQSAAEVQVLAKTVAIDRHVEDAIESERDPENTDVLLGLDRVLRRSLVLVLLHPIRVHPRIRTRDAKGIEDPNAVAENRNQREKNTQTMDFRRINARFLCPN